MEEYNECYLAYRIMKEKTNHTKMANSLKRIVDLFEDSESKDDKIENLEELVKKANIIISQLREEHTNG